MPNLVNRMVVGELTRELGEAEGLVVLSFGGLTVAESEGLRDQLAAKGVRLRLVRNSLARRVLEERGLAFPDGALQGNTAIAYGDTEAAIQAAKILTSTEVKKAGKVALRAGMLEGRMLDARDAAALADVPDRNTLNARLLGALSGPARGVAGLLNAVPSSLARLLDARAKKLAEGAPAEAQSA
jgi:large subunit ribosomal protein L10